MALQPERLAVAGPQLYRLSAAVVAVVLALVFGLDVLADCISPHAHDY
jgi:hypothetical protein